MHIFILKIKKMRFKVTELGKVTKMRAIPSLLRLVMPIC